VKFLTRPTLSNTAATTIKFVFINCDDGGCLLVLADSQKNITEYKWKLKRAEQEITTLKGAVSSSISSSSCCCY